MAVTPSGSYRIESQGARASATATSASLYNPLYFQGGYAIHGSPSVPARPASHGCVRSPSLVALVLRQRAQPHARLSHRRQDPATPSPPKPDPTAARQRQRGAGVLVQHPGRVIGRWTESPGRIAPPCSGP